MGDRMGESAKGRVTSQSDSASISTELAARRTGLSFQRTRMSADRTLMSVIRTSLSLIGFGFTIFQVFQKLHETQVLKSSEAALHFGLALVVLGVAMLVVGIGYHVVYMYGLRKERVQLKADGLIHAESQFPLSLTLMVALLLLGIGFMAIASMVFGVGPFG
jgi:putative membrane protein